MNFRVRVARKAVLKVSRSRTFDEPITTIGQAKEYFLAMGCSHFHMDREYAQRYEEYCRLNITKQTETEWRQERFDDYYIRCVEYPCDDPLFDLSTEPLWWLHSSMCDLFEALKTDTALMKMLEVTQQIRDKVPLEDRVIVAETINGRTDRTVRRGLIYLAYDLGNIPAAKAFVELALHFSVYDKHHNRGIERCQRAAQLSNDIKLELGL